jgi:hypothetical protein
MEKIRKYTTDKEKFTALLAGEKLCYSNSSNWYQLSENGDIVWFSSEDSETHPVYYKLFRESDLYNVADFKHYVTFEEAMEDMNAHLGYIYSFEGSTNTYCIGDTNGRLYKLGILSDTLTSVTYSMITSKWFKVQ